jgi:hypothetical protein
MIATLERVHIVIEGDRAEVDATVRIGKDGVRREFQFVADYDDQLMLPIEQLRKVLLAAIEREVRSWLSD